MKPINPKFKEYMSEVSSCAEEVVNAAELKHVDGNSYVIRVSKNEWQDLVKVFNRYTKYRKYSPEELATAVFSDNLKRAK